MPHIRAATPDDAAAIAGIYNPYVQETPLSFEISPVSAEEMASRIAAVLHTHPYLVAHDDLGLLGYSYAGPHRNRAAYDWSTETSVWVAPRAHRRGVGRALMEAVLTELRRRGFVNAFAGITLPNAGSVGLHEALGFVPVGVYRNVGFKQGAWHDVGWWQLELVPLPAVPRLQPR